MISQQTIKIRSRSSSLTSGSEKVSMTDEEFRQMSLEFWLKIDSLENELARERKERHEYQKATYDLQDELKKVTKELRNTRRDCLEGKQQIKTLEKRNDELRSTRSKLEIQINKYKEEIRGLNRGIQKRDLAKSSRRSDSTRRQSNSSTSNDKKSSSGSSSNSSRQVYVRNISLNEQPTTSNAKTDLKRSHESDKNKRKVFIPAPVPASPTMEPARKVSFKIASRPAPGPALPGVFTNSSSRQTNRLAAGPQRYSDDEVDLLRFSSKQFNDDHARGYSVEASIAAVSRSDHTSPDEFQGQFRCPLCNDQFRHLANLQFHHRFEHAKTHPFTCVLCPFSHGDYMTVKNHIKHHEMDKQAPTSIRCKIADCKVFSRNLVEQTQHQTMYH